MIHRFVELPELIRYSPPFTVYQTSGDVNVFRSATTDAAGTPTSFTSYADGGTTTSDMHNPVLSPDGSKIAYEQRNSFGYLEIWVVDDVPGSTPTQVATTTDRYSFHPMWHPNSDTLVYIVGGGTAFGGTFDGGTIWKKNVSGGSATSLKVAASGLSPFRPAFNFDGSRIAYIWNKDNFTSGSQLRVMDDDGTNDASVDTITARQTDGAQLSWANTQNTVAYDNGAGGSNGIYLVNDDGTGKTQINANGVASGAGARISSFAWPPDDSYVVISANLGLGVGYNPVKCALNGSTTTDLNASHGASTQAHFQYMIVYDGRIWFIDIASGSSGGRLASVAIDGTGYRIDCNLPSGSVATLFSSGSGFYFT